MTKRKDPALFVKMRPWQDRFFDRVAFDGTACWVWTGAKNRKGYGAFAPGTRMLPGDAPMAAPRSPTMELAHRFIYAALRGAPANECLMHACDRPECVNPWHLTDATLAENNMDMFSKGRGQATEGHSLRMKTAAARGERHACAKLNDAIVREIRAQRAKGRSYADIGRALRIRGTAVRDVAVGRTWRHVQ